MTRLINEKRKVFELRREKYAFLTKYSKADKALTEIVEIWNKNKTPYKTSGYDLMKLIDNNEIIKLDLKMKSDKNTIYFFGVESTMKPIFYITMDYSLVDYINDLKGVR
jgi:hypothetical protein